MKPKLQLSLDQLEVTTFEAQKVQPQADPNAAARTCLDTDCGNILCCA